MENNDDIRETLANNFPSNSKSQKPKADSSKIPEGKKVEKGCYRDRSSGKKRGFGKKMAETFLEDNTRSVGDYVFHDVLIPAAKSMICDIVGWGGFAEMLLFGSVRGGSRSPSKADVGRSPVTIRHITARHQKTLEIAEERYLVLVELATTLTRLFSRIEEKLRMFFPIWLILQSTTGRQRSLTCMT